MREICTGTHVWVLKLKQSELCAFLNVVDNKVNCVHVYLLSTSHMHIHLEAMCMHSRWCSVTLTQPT